jgi:hypothetical protein
MMSSSYIKPKNQAANVDHGKKEIISFKISRHTTPSSVLELKQISTYLQHHEGIDNAGH